MRKIAGAAVLLAVSSILGLVVSFATQAYLAYLFGAGAEMDAYVAAMTLPALFVAVVIPSLSIVLIPIFVESMHQRGADESWRMASNLLNLTALVLAASVAVVMPFVGHLMRWTLSGLDAPTMSLAIALVHWLLPAQILSALVAALSGLYQAQERFWPTAIAPLIGSTSLLTAAVILTPAFGIRGIAYATVIGNLAQVLVLLPVLRGHYRPVVDLRDKTVRRFGMLLLPLVLGGLAYRATIVADRAVASWLPKGSLSHLEYAGRIATLLNLLFASGIAAALYPRMSGQAAAGDLPRLRDTLVWGMRTLMLFLFPALAVGWVLRLPLLEVLFQRGLFTAADTQAVAALLTWFMIGVIGGALGALQARVYYVLKDTRTPVLLGLMETGAYFLYLPVLARAHGAVGVAMANAIYLVAALLVNGLVVLYKLRTRRSADLFLGAARTGLFAVVAGIAAWLVVRALHGALLVLIAGSLAGGLCYLGLLALVHARELRDLGALLADVGAPDG